MKTFIVVFTVLAAFTSPAFGDVAVRIDRVESAVPGDFVAVGVGFEDPTGVFRMGGFDLVVRYDTNLTLGSVTAGQFVTECEWEYFDYRQVATYEVRLSAIANINNGSHVPLCHGDSAGEFGNLHFNIAQNQLLVGEYLSVRFKWYDCGDNGISSKFGDTLYVSDQVFHYDGVQEYDITADTAFPTLRGAPYECVGADSAEFRVLDFYNGGINLAEGDTEAPVALCPADTTVPAEPGVCGATVLFEASVTDNEPGATIGCSPASGTFFPVGTTTVECIAVDGSGNLDSCWFQITVVDTFPPAIDTGTHQVVATDSGQCRTVVDLEVPVTDNCGSVSVTYAPPSGSFFPVGTTSVTVVAVDNAGMADTATTFVTVNDTEAPVLTCPQPLTVDNAPGVCGAWVTYAPEAADNCSDVQLTLIPPSGLLFPVGVTPVRIIATDSAGNADSCLFRVTVVDTESPVIEVVGDTIVAADSAYCGANVEFDLSATDNCGSATVWSEPPSGTFFPLGSTAVTIVAEDGLGHRDTVHFTVTVVDSQPPDLAVPENITVENDAGVCGAFVDYSVSATDGCGPVTVSTQPPSGTLFPVGTGVVEVTATDSSGNVATGSFTVAVEDSEYPVLLCPDSVATVNDSGYYGAYVAYEIAADDNCPGLVLSATPESGSFFPNGETSVRAIVMDAAGLADTCLFPVIVVLNDPDGDGLPDWDDNCPDTANLDQKDTDDDGVGDACCCEVRGDVDNRWVGGNAITVADLTFLVDYLMRGGAEPPCPEQADADGTGSAGEGPNISDIVFLVEFLFRTGPLPPPCP